MSVVASNTREAPAAPDGAPLPEGLARLRVAGALTAGTAPSLRACVRDAARDGRTRVMVDLQAVTALDAAGIAALRDARTVLEAQTGGTPFLRANGLVCRALKETGTLAAFALWNGPGM